MASIPEKYNHKDLEPKWIDFWSKEKTYNWDSDKSDQEVFVVDTPPPTVSGSLHIGHVFSYTHTDVIVRYQRMLGKNIMYPMGWDDNGLPTERRVQNKFGIRCNAKLPYVEGWKPVEVVGKQRPEVEEVSRKNFIEACNLVTCEDERVFEKLWTNLGLSVDWSEQYSTIGEHCRVVSQASFLDLVERDLVYSAESPTMWDVDFRTALAQADIEDRELPGAYCDIEFAVDGGGSFVISTTRPELLVSCIAVVAHPDDERYKSLFGKKAITPLFSAEVPIVASSHADPEKGSGIMMVCTFGDYADVVWWKASGFAIKQVIRRDGRFSEVDFTQVPFLSRSPELAATNYAELLGKTVKQARKAVVELLSQEGSSLLDSAKAALCEKPREIQHPVKFYEKGDRPIEFVSTRQWFIKILENKEPLLKQGEKINWHPSFMKARYDNWVAGLNHDWCISRQRFFGVPFPVWYEIDQSGEVDYGRAIYADSDSLPVDPSVDCPPGFSESQRGQVGGFFGDPDVMDTWATSSLTPQIVSHWKKDDLRHSKLFPMDIRPQSHEIIRTWAFYTICKAWMHSGEIPWKNVIISGWILDPDRKKMSKSKGNVVTPQHLLDEYSSDAVRYWAARAKLGVDTAFDETVFKTGRKLVTKLFNASRFVFMQWDEFDSAYSPKLEDVTETLDRAFLKKLSGVVERASASFQNFEYAQALREIESSFWGFL